MADQITDEERRLINAAIADGAAKTIRVPEPRGTKIEKRRAELRRLLDARTPLPAIAEALGVSLATIHIDRAALGLVRPRGPRQPDGDKAARKRAARAVSGAEAVRDRRRFKSVAVPFGAPGVVVAAETKGTIFPERVFVPDGEELVLKDGCNNAKIGGDVLVGRLRGAYIATLTLEERATCPRNCAMWQGCYGNSMHHSRRWAPGPALEAQLRAELSIACAKNDQVLIHLHVLGDFYSFDYLRLWAEALDTHQNLSVFGFTAWLPGTEIGDGVRRLRKAYPDRFMIRHSGMTGRWGSFTLPFPTQEKMIGDAIVCPEQLDAMSGGKQGTHCGNCAACWSCDRPIAFVQH